MSVNYNISILAIFKNEESFMKEWLDHYFNRNIDHIYLLNDNSIDNSVEIINQHQNKKNITLLHTTEDDINTQNGRQTDLYNKYYNYILKETRWIGIFDLDEFCYSPEILNFNNILKYYDIREKIQEIIIDWYWFGSNNYNDQPKNIVNSFNKRGSELSKKIIQKYSIIPYNMCYKSFAKTKNIKLLNHHSNIFNYYDTTTCSGGLPAIFNDNLSEKNIMFINHYIGAKNYYFNNKVIRGSCNNSLSIKKNKDIIYDIINLNEVEDNRLKNQNEKISNLIKDRGVN